MSVGCEKRYACICLITCEYVSDLGLLMYRMNMSRHCGCMGHCCRYQRMKKKPRADLASHLERLEEFIHRTLGEDT